ncbi:major facilitator superfamily domain-containing protein [Boeremia exigua]|uniref:major facilitator superfamily domain-containing protein n=1 Tax=Boeremia exigua TaxID=749465 RepID=UPI001E8E55F3|nr:major facilitator superfamily domain-containing protein [Boeremia exigua]KAH6643148.1 major facilitator superfamily domain-containing protein [Boeremia exigua]
MTVSQEPRAEASRPTKLTSGATIKRLPWLDGRNSRALNHPSGNHSSSNSSALAIPKRTATAHATATSSAPVAQKKLVSSKNEQRILEMDSPLESSLSPVSRHQMAHDRRVSRDAAQCAASTPVVVSRVQTSPSRPRPLQVGERRIGKAVEDLEDMVQEAVEIADDAADYGLVEEIYDIIKDARQATQEASGHPARHLMITSSPLPASDSSLQGQENRGNWTELSPPPPLIVQRNIFPDSVDILPPQVQVNLQRGPLSVDWAYQPHRGPTSITSSSSRSSSDGRGRSRLGTLSDLLLPPDPSQPAPREHVDHVLRHLRDHSRGRSHHRIVRDRAVRSRKPHRHRRLRSVSSPDRGARTTSRPHCTGQSCSESSFSGQSCDEEHLPSRPYGGTLHLWDQAQRHTVNRRQQHRRQPIARNWGTGKKRLAAVIACINTALLGIVIGVYAGEVPRIQYYLADEGHIAILGNVLLYIGLAVSTCVVWPLPLLHGRKPYILAALTLAMPLQFPQAMILSAKRSPTNEKFRAGLLIARVATGLVLGFANVNYITVLLDLFGASLQSKNPHQEYVVPNDVRRHGGGMGLWLGIWSWCWIASLAVGFMVGAVIIEHLSPDWGFYVVIIILSAALVLNIIAPETRRAACRKSVMEVYDRDENYLMRRVSRGECKLHISAEGPKYWFEEVWAGLKLMVMMMCQPGFFVLALYLAWIYTQVVLVIVLLTSLLSRNYKWQPRFVGAGVTSIAIGAFLALPLTKARIFSRERKNSFRTDSMTFQKQVTWSSHLVRRTLFTVVLPLMGLAYTISSAGRPRPYMVPIVFAGALGFFSILAIAECHGLMMETFDTCDLQPGVNTKHRLQSMAVQDRRRRTNFSSFPRVTAGIFASQTLAFIGGAVATEVGGIMTRRLGAQLSTGVTAAILMFLTVALTLVLARFKSVQVIPNHTFGTRRDTAAWEEFGQLEKMGRGSDWKAVVIGNPSGKMRRMSVLELGALSRWTEIRKLNFLLKGPRLGEAKSGRRPRTWRDG